MWHRLASQLRRLSSFPSRRRLRLLRETQYQLYQHLFQQAQIHRPLPTGNWYPRMANKEIRDPAPEKETFPGTVIGYRAFGVRVYAPDPPAVQYLLRPVGRLEMPPWTPGWNQARCAVGAPGEDHGPVPSRGCGCGFWAFYHPRGHFHPGRFHISANMGAVIEGAGRVYLHTEGFRAERARVKALFALNPFALNPVFEDAPAVGAAYGVDFYHSRSLVEKVFPPTNPKDFGIMPEVEANPGDQLWPGWGLPASRYQLWAHQAYRQAVYHERIRFTNG